MSQAEDSVFDEIKESFTNFLERLGEIIGFDADQYRSNETSNWFLRKSTLVTLGEALLSVFFIFDALEKTRDTSKTAHIVSHALHARDITLSNANQPFRFSEVFDQTTIFWILRISGVIQLIAALALNFYENPVTKKVCAATLITLLILVDTFLVNFPKSTHEPAIYAHEVNQCVANIGLVAGLLMVFGLREKPRKFKN